MNKQLISILVIAFALVVVIFTIYKWIDGWVHFAGSYPYAEIYELNYKEADVIKAINKLKTNAPQLAQLPPVFTDGRTDSSDYWYNVYFYLPNENRVIFAWTRPSNDSSKTSFAFISLMEVKEKEITRRDVNKDYGFFENKRVKELFENNILEKVEEILRN